MTDVQNLWKKRISDALNSVLALENREEKINQDQIVIELPPKPEYGDFAFPMFTFAKIFRRPPQKIAEAAAEHVQIENDEMPGTLSAVSGYINVFLKRAAVFSQVLEEVLSQGTDYGKNQSLKGQNIMVEFSCPNTNKPLHLGHLRNDSIGEAVSKILMECGAEVRKVNLINDRGIHICKSMLAYEKYGNGTDPEKEHRKSDHFVGDYYVKFNEWSKSDPSAEKQAQVLLQKWESNDPEVVSLWKQMNTWAIDGIKETYNDTGVSFDEIYFESNTYMLGRDQVLQGLEDGVFYKDEEGTVWVDLDEIDLDKKVLLRKDGTSLYLTQDIGTAIQRHKDWPFNRCIYVVGSEQKYHFTVLFHVLKKLNHPWADNLYHLSYGMVNLPEGKMKSREGTVVDADDLLEELKTLAAKEIKEKEREDEVDDLGDTAASVALSALNYFLLKVNPSKDMVFNPKESLSFNGDTGPYLQYMGARISSMLKKYNERKEKYTGGEFDPELLTVQDEWELVKLLSSYPNVVKYAAEDLNPSRITAFLFELAKNYSRYYHDNPILHNENADLVASRIYLSKALLQILKNAFTLLGIPFMEIM